MTKTKGIDRKNLGSPTEAVDSNQPPDYSLIDIVALAPFRDAFRIARPAIEKPVYVLLADHVARREALEAALKNNRPPFPLRRQ